MHERQREIDAARMQFAAALVLLTHSEIEDDDQAHEFAKHVWGELESLANATEPVIDG